MLSNSWALSYLRTRPGGGGAPPDIWQYGSPPPTSTNTTAHRYWRLLLNNGTGSNAQYDEYKFLDGSGTLLSTGGTPAASSTFSGSFPVSEGFDGVINDSTNRHVFSGIPANSWVSYDFGSAVLVKQIEMWTTGFQQWFQTVQVQWSDDNSSWTSIGPSRTLIWPGFHAKMFWWVEDPDDATEEFEYWQFYGADTYNTAFPDHAQYNEIRLYDEEDNQLTIVGGFSPDGNYDGSSGEANLYDNNTTSTRWATAKEGDGSSVWLQLSAPARVARAEMWSASSYEQIWIAIDLYGGHDYYNRHLKSQVSGISLPTASGKKIDVDWVTGGVATEA